MIVMMTGLPGTGKSTLARALAQRLPGAVLDKDAIRAALFQPAYVEYSLAQDDFCQEIMLQTAAYLLARDAELHVLLDGRTFSRRYQRERAMEFCRQVGAACATLECVCAERSALARLAEAMAQNTHRSSIGKFARRGSRSTAPNSLSTRMRTWTHASIALCATSRIGPATRTMGDRNPAVHRADDRCRHFIPFRRLRNRWIGSRCRA
jgi:adenylylsulfate kinase